MAEPRVLSIQSHVVRGYVGNNAATFPLQMLGFEVDAINSVQLCNHTGYEHFMGQVLQAADLETLFRGLKVNNLLTYSHVLTGYVGAKSFLEGVHSIVTDLKKVNPDVLFVCDPVLGDNGKFYVPEDLMPVYRDQLVPLADILTPNQFEAELLSGISIKTKEDALKAIDILHDKGAKIVMITSSDLSGDDNILLALGSTKGGEVIEVAIPKLPAIFVGTGDLFTGLLMAWLFKEHSLRVACQKTVSTMQTVLRRTLDHAKALAGDKEPTCGQLELRLIQSKDVIENPPAGCFEPSTVSK